MTSMSATTPRRANMTAPHSPSKTTPRRVLGDLAPVALNTPSKQPTAFDSSEAMRAQSPLKQVTTLSPQVFSGKENLAHAGAYPQGKERSIYEVDGAENVEHTKIKFATRDQGISGAEMSLTAAAVQRHMEYTAIDLPVPGSPTERNTPTPEPEELPGNENSLEEPPSQESFSAYLNYDACSSQKCQTDQPQMPVEEVKVEKKSRAELLRTRLGFASYKVRTEQITKAGSDIISKWESSSPESIDASIPVASFAESNASNSVPSITLSPVRRDNQPVFVKANLDPFRPIGKLTPAPVLLPTAVSSRMMHDYHMPSSPPQAVSPEQLTSSAKQISTYGTPASKRTRQEDNEEGHREGSEESVQGRLQRMQERRLQEGELTSSAVKGHAAKSLMKLAGKR